MREPFISVYRKYLVVALLFHVFHGLSAQEFWMMPEKFQYGRGDTVRVMFNVGENFAGETWNLRPERIGALSLYVNSIATDVKSRAVPGRGDHLLIPAAREGTYLFAMEGENAFVELPAERFNAYLKEHALDDVIARRKNANDTDRPGREMYRRVAKLIVQVGDHPDDSYREAVGLPLEIVPGKHPSTMKKGDIVPFRILFNGKPDFGARVYVWNSKDHKVFVQPVYSQQNGTVDVRIFNDGDWMISVVEMVPSDSPGADWQSFWSSLVFHVEGQ